MCYDTLLFIEIIESIQGIKFLGQITEDDIIIMKYQSLDGRLVLIDTTDEEMTPETGTALLIKLGLPHLVISLFPEMDAKLRAIGHPNYPKT